MEMKAILKQLFEYRSLDFSQAKEVMLRMSEGAYNEHELSSFMTVYLMRTITIDELLGFREALLSLALPLDLQQENLLDIVGTGGDGKNSHITTHCIQGRNRIFTGRYTRKNGPLVGPHISQSIHVIF